MQAAFDGAFRNIQYFGNFWSGQAMIEDQYQHFALLFWQTLDGGTNFIVFFGAFKCLTLLELAASLQATDG